MAAGEQTRLSAELQYYEDHKAEWLTSSLGRYVVIKGQDTLGFFDSFEEAYRAAALRWGVDTDFLIRKLVEHEPIFIVY